MAQAEPTKSAGLQEVPMLWRSSAHTHRWRLRECRWSRLGRSGANCSCRSCAPRAWPGPPAPPASLRLQRQEGGDREGCVGRAGHSMHTRACICRPGSMHSRAKLRAAAGWAPPSQALPASTTGQRCRSQSPSALACGHDIKWCSKGEAGEVPHHAARHHQLDLCGAQQAQQGEGRERGRAGGLVGGSARHSCSRAWGARCTSAAAPASPGLPPIQPAACSPAHPFFQPRVCPWAAPSTVVGRTMTRGRRLYCRHSSISAAHGDGGGGVLPAGAWVRLRHAAAATSRHYCAGGCPAITDVAMQLHDSPARAVE